MKSLSSKKSLSQSTVRIATLFDKLINDFEHINSFYETYRAATTNRISQNLHKLTLKRCFYSMVHVIVFNNYRRAVRHESFIAYANDNINNNIFEVEGSSDMCIHTLNDMPKEIIRQRIEETHQNMQEALSA